MFGFGVARSEVCSSLGSETEAVGLPWTLGSTSVPRFWKGVD